VRDFSAAVKLVRERCHLPEIAEAAWATLEPLWQGRNVALRQEVNGVDLCASVDPFRLEQVFRNLLENSLAACRDPAEIVISWSEAEHDARPAVQVILRDNGPDLTLEQRQNVFEPFYTTKLKGTGLGMAIARRLVEAHGGRISVGNFDGPGAEFSFVLPRGEV
jgi:signal transduction histidine kinase